MATYLAVPPSTPDWDPRSLRDSTTRLITASVSLSSVAVPCLAKPSIAAIRASSEARIPSASSRSGFSQSIKRL